MNLLFSYLDAGTGSIVIQSVVGIVAGVGVFGRKFIRNTGTKLRSTFSKSNSFNTNDKS